MAEPVFFHGTMNRGKSTLALQVHHNAISAGKHRLLFTKHDRAGGTISSRIGRLSQPATVVHDDLDLVAHVRAVIAAGTPVDTLICDEAQFYTAVWVEQLAELVDDLEVDVQAFGLLPGNRTGGRGRGWWEVRFCTSHQPRPAGRIPSTVGHGSGSPTSATSKAPR